MQQFSELMGKIPKFYFHSYIFEAEQNRLHSLMRHLLKVSMNQVNFPSLSFLFLNDSATQIILAY